jgi:hypothetical protein
MSGSSGNTAHPISAANNGSGIQELELVIDLPDRILYVLLKYPSHHVSSKFSENSDEGWVLILVHATAVL